MKSELATFHRRKAGGHYARVMGTLHRHTKVEHAGDAALGMLVRIWSYCADTGRNVLTERDMAVIMVRDRNGPRKLKALLDARLLDEVDGGYSPHDWFDHNPGLATDGESNMSETRSEREANVTGNVTGNVSRSAKQNQGLTHPLSDPGPKSKELRTPLPPVGGGDLGSPAAANANSDRPISGSHSQSFDLALGEAAEAMDWKPAPRIGHAMRGQIIQRCREYSSASGLDFLEACRVIARDGLLLARSTTKSPASALLEVEPGKGPPRRFGGGGRPERARATTGADFADAPSIEEQIKRMGGVT